MSSTGNSARKSRGISDELSGKERLRLAGIKLFARHGFAGTGIRELGSEAGLSLSVLYHHLGTKTNLLVDIMERSLRRLIGLAETVVAEGATPEERLAALVRVHVIAHARAPDETTVVDMELRALGGEQRQHIIALRDRYEALWQSVIDDGRRARTFTVADSKLARISLLEMCSSVGQWYVPDGPLTLEDVAGTYVDMVLALVRAERSGAAIRVGDVPAPPFAHYHELIDAAWARG